MIQLTKDMFVPFDDARVIEILKGAETLRIHGTCPLLNCDDCLFSEVNLEGSFSSAIACSAIQVKFGVLCDDRQKFRKEVAEQFIKLFSEPDTIKLDLTE